MAEEANFISVNHPVARSKRFSRPLRKSGISVDIPVSRDLLKTVPEHQHEELFVEILRKHGLPIKSPVPLVGRYSKSRRWSAEELDACKWAHKQGVSIALMSAALNRNPQDIIFRLLDECYDEPGGFRQVSLQGANSWNDQLLTVGRELFEAGLAAWRIAALFGVDFEGAEKLLYKGREDYGHVKKNPFAICTDHKQLVNKTITRRRGEVTYALEAFAGEGRFAEIITELYPDVRLLCIEQDDNTFAKATEERTWPTNVRWVKSDNIPVLEDLINEGGKFNLIDLDPFVTCRDQIDLIWKLLADDAALFITFGGEYRRSFIGGNRKAIARRYGFFNETLSNSDYLEVVPAFFFGWVASQAAMNGFVLNIEYCVRYPNNCRFWLSAKVANTKDCEDWRKENVVEIDGGFFWKDLVIPRFAEVRYRTDEMEQGIPYTPRENKSKKKKADTIQVGLFL